MFVHPRRKKTAEADREIHAIEIEQPTGFDVRSVHQAYAQARGAKYAWRFVSRPHTMSDVEWDRIVDVATDLGVGLVTFVAPHVWDGYAIRVPARRLEGAPKSTSDYCTFVGVEWHR